MTYGEDYLVNYIEGCEIIKGQKLYMIPDVFRCVLCPNGELTFIKPNELISAYIDLHTWALPINELACNQ